jgi:hypothetical protein
MSPLFDQNLPPSLTRRLSDILPSGIFSSRFREANRLFVVKKIKPSSVGLPESAGRSNLD